MEPGRDREAGGSSEVPPGPGHSWMWDLSTHGHTPSPVGPAAGLGRFSVAFKYLSSTYCVPGLELDAES